MGKRGTKSQKFRRTPISTDIILCGSKLTSLSCYTLKLLLFDSIGITGLQQQSFMPKRLSMKFLDNFFAYLAAFETMLQVIPSILPLSVNCSPYEINNTTHPISM